MRYIVRFLALAVVMIAILSRSAAGQEECWQCQSEEGNPTWGTIHWDDVQQWVPAMAPDGKHESWGLHMCYDVHQNPEPNECEGRQDEEQLAALSTLMKGVDDLPTGELATLLLRAGDRAFLNHARQAVQIIACGSDDVVIAHFKLSELRLAEVSLHLGVSVVQSATLD